jgi:hypothetical protein
MFSWNLLPGAALLRGCSIWGLVPWFDGVGNLLQKGRGKRIFPRKAAIFSGISLADSGKTDYHRKMRFTRMNLAAEDNSVDRHTKGD